MNTVFYKVPCYDIISLSSATWQQDFFKTYSNKVGHNKHTIVVSTGKILWSSIKMIYINITMLVEQYYYGLFFKTAKNYTCLHSN
jgi:hypothetical protein